MNNINTILNNLSKSKFRNSFKLGTKEIQYIKQKGMGTIRQHAFIFIEKRLSKSTITNDGKQTPMKGHPVFIAQHATATCCRSCIYKWHHIKPNKELDKNEQEYLANVIMYWIENQYHKLYNND